MKTGSSFHSLLDKDIQIYLNFKRAIGRKFHNEEAGLRLLDRFLTDHSVVDCSALTPPLIEVFLASRPRTRPRSFNHILGVIRCFFDWLVIQGRLAHSPVQARPRRDNSRRRPFLFEPEEVKRLLDLAAQLPDNSRACHRGEVYVLIFRLMYGLGLRVGEVTRLINLDVDRNRRLLIIRETKFGKSRFVPFGPHLGQHIEGYLIRRVNWYSEWQPDDPLFSFSNHQKRPLRPETISQTFHHLLPKLRLSIPAGGDAPRLHCLRHSFAVQTLLRWYHAGIDPGCRLFHLSTFMGHADPASTSWYLTITEALLATANQRFERWADVILQEVRG